MSNEQLYHNRAKHWDRVYKTAVLCLLVVLLISSGIGVARVFQISAQQTREVTEAANRNETILSEVRDQNDKLINYLRCTSLIPTEERTESMVEECFNQVSMTGGRVDGGADASAGPNKTTNTPVPQASETLATPL